MNTVLSNYPNYLSHAIRAKGTWVDGHGHDCSVFESLYDQLEFRLILLPEFCAFCSYFSFLVLTSEDGFLCDFIFVFLGAKLINV